MQKVLSQLKELSVVSPQNQLGGWRKIGGERGLKSEIMKSGIYPT